MKAETSSSIQEMINNNPVINKSVERSEDTEQYYVVHFDHMDLSICRALIEIVDKLNNQTRLLFFMHVSDEALLQVKFFEM
ncbi:hypothetical protein [Emticicia fontis]